MFPTERGLKHHLKTGHIHQKIKDPKFKAIKKGIILMIIQVAAIVKHTKVLDFGNLNDLLEVNCLQFRFIESLYNTASLRNLNFCAHSARLLRKLDHVMLWILSTNTGLCQRSICADQRKFQ